MSRTSAERRTRNSIAVLAGVHLAVAVFTVVVGFLMAGATAQTEPGAAGWYRALAVLGAVPLAVLGVALVRLYQAPPPPDGRLSRLARASYLAIGAVAVMAIATVVAGFTELGSSVVVVLQPVGLLLVAPATWTYFRVRSGRADESHDAS